MENLMFCYQCEQTFGGKGCTKANEAVIDKKIS